MGRDLVTYRVLVGDDHHDVVVAVTDTASVADLAGSIATWTETTGGSVGDEPAARPDEDLTLELATDPLADGSARCGGGIAPVADPDRLAAEAAPPSGSTVRVVAGRSSTIRPPMWSPASLQSLSSTSGPTAQERTPDSPTHSTDRLPYGTTVLGTALVQVATTISIHATGMTERLEVDGSPVRGSAAARHGSILRVGDSTYVLRVTGPLRPPADSGPWRVHRAAPAVHEEPEPDPVELPTPPSAERTPGFPYLSAAVPLLMGGAMWLATHSLAVAGFVLFSVAFVVASGIEARREHRKDRRFREQAFLRELDAATESTRIRRTEELSRAGRDLPTGDEVATWATDDQRRIWERRTDRPGALRVRIGTERAAPHDPIIVPKGGREDLRERLDELAEELGVIVGPASVDLDVSGLAIVGDGDEPAAAARSVVVQLTGLLGPDHLELEVDSTAGRAVAWEWLRWLPHRVVFLDENRPSRNGPDGSHPDDSHPDDRHAEVRHSDEGGATGDGRIVIRLVDRAAAVHEPGAPRRILIAPGEADVPAGYATVIGSGARSTSTRTRPSVAGPGSGWIRRDDGPDTELVLEQLPQDRCEPTARALAPLRDIGTDESSIPSTVGLSQVIAETEALRSDGVRHVIDAWEASRRRPRSMAAPIGRGPGGVMHIDLRSDGPHGLVAGTTGSGKSELLRTLVTSLALHHPPDRLTFLLVDFKGGAAFSPVAGLPHVVGVVTDLGEAEARRALTSLRAEVRRREQVVAEVGATDMVDVDPERAEPALVVVVDEFATLAREVPDLLDGLLDVAQRGRSLGIHLVLATQRPSGVVTDAVRANLSLRIALRVSDEDDSRDVVDVTDAAHIPTELPGRAILRTGPHRSVRLQVADSSRSGADHVAARCRDLVCDPPTTRLDGNGESPMPDIERAVANCRAAAIECGIGEQRRPWVDPLPDLVDLELTPPPLPGLLVIGEVDVPDEQRRGPATIDLGSSGNVLVLGAPRSGRTTALSAIAAAATVDPTTPTSVYGFGATPALSDLLRRLGPSGRIADSIGIDDAERTLRLLRNLHRHVTGVLSPDTAPLRERVVLLVDGIGAFVDRHEAVNRGEAVDLLVAIASAGPAAGVHLAVTAGRDAEVPSTLAPSLDRRLVLGSRSPWELEPDPSSPPGRGHLDGAVLQVGVPGPVIDDVAPDAIDGDPAKGTGLGPIGRLPGEVDSTTLPTARGWAVPVGIGHDDLEPAFLDLTHSGALVVGPPRSGRTTAMRTVLGRVCAAQSDIRVVWIDPMIGDDAVEVVRLAVDGPGGSTDDPLSRTLLLIDDLPDLLDGPRGTELDEMLDRLLRRRSSASVRVVATGEADTVSRCYAESIRRLRSTRTGILLRPDVDLHPAILHSALPRHDELAQGPGRGWIVTPDEVAAVQLAR